MDWWKAFEMHRWWLKCVVKKCQGSARAYSYHVKRDHVPVMVSINATSQQRVAISDIHELQSMNLFPFSTESYLSIGPDMTIEFMPNPSGTPHLYGPSSAFKLRYEFLDTQLGGAPLEPFSKSTGPKAMPEPAALLQTQSKSCNRVYR